MGVSYRIDPPADVRARARFIVLVALESVAVAGCSGESAGDDGSGSASASGPATGTTGGASHCEFVQDEEPLEGAASTIRIRNASDEVQYLLPFALPTGCAPDPALVAVTVPGVERNTPQPVGATCWVDGQWSAPSQCTDPYVGWGEEGCDENFGHDSVAIAPGGVLEVAWDGRLWRSFLDVSECRDCEICGGCDILEGEPPYFLGCRVAVALAPGTAYDLELGVSTCPGGEPDACACVSGTCPFTTYDWAGEADRIVQAQGIVGEDLEVVLTP